jgi:dynein heavy chain
MADHSRDSTVSAMQQHANITSLTMDSSNGNDTSKLSTTVSITEMVARFKSLVTLSAYSPDMWNDELTSIVTDFLQDSARRKIILFLDQERKPPVLCLVPTIPKQNVQELMYFLKEAYAKGEKLDHENFERKIQYGTVNGNTMDSLLRLMQGVYVPLFFENKQWPESVQKVGLSI